MFVKCASWELPADSCHSAAAGWVSSHRRFRHHEPVKISQRVHDSHRYSVGSFLMTESCCPDSTWSLQHHGRSAKLGLSWFSRFVRWWMSGFSEWKSFLEQQGSWSRPVRADSSQPAPGIGALQSWSKCSWTAGFCLLSSKLMRESIRRLSHDEGEWGQFKWFEPNLQWYLQPNYAHATFGCICVAPRRIWPIITSTCISKRLEGNY